MAWKEHFRHTLSADPARLHFAAHSHHAWPDVSRKAQLTYWDDTAKHLDEKWDKIFGVAIPEAQQNVASHLNLSESSQIQFFSNTHDFLVRLLSCFELHKGFRVLTTDSEFYSFERQMLRLQEMENIEVKRIATEPFSTFKDRFLEEAKSGNYDLTFLSHVFFNSGWRVQLDSDWLSFFKQNSGVTVIDGYHSYFAVPIDWSEYEQNVFFIAGGYKYAQVGEGACFATIPKSFRGRPWNTGWMADFESLKSGLRVPVSYANDGSRFAGATFDGTAIYRLNAVSSLWKGLGVTVGDIHKHVQDLQMYFFSRLRKARSNHPLFNLQAWLLDPAKDPMGHFITWRGGDAELWHRRLREQNIITDTRKNSLRLGFGVYHDRNDIDDFFQRVDESI